MTKEEFVAKRKADEQKSFLQSAQEFGEGAVEGAKMIGKQAYDASLEFGDLVEKSKARVRFNQPRPLMNLESMQILRVTSSMLVPETLCDSPFSRRSCNDKLGDFTEEEEIDREYERYIQNFDYNTKVRLAMLESDEIEYKKVVDFEVTSLIHLWPYRLQRLSLHALR